MLNSDELTFSSYEFLSVVRLFPMPNYVMFSHNVQSFHVFEPRYKDLVQDVINTAKLIAMIRLKEGGRADYAGRPPIADVGCLGRMFTYLQLVDDRFNLLLAAGGQLRIQKEREFEYPFREAEAELIEDVYPVVDAPHRCELQAVLIRRFRMCLSRISETQQQIDEILDSDNPLEVLTDFGVFVLEPLLKEKQKLLAKTDVDRRIASLINSLARLASNSAVSFRENFPPDFSIN